MFPAEIGGWEKRRAASGVDLFTVREIPILQGFNTGIPGAPGAKQVHRVMVRVLKGAA
jgi:hypothetical protein